MSAKNWYDKSYKYLLLVPIVVLLISAGYLYNFQSQHGDVILKDVTLTGGTTLSVFDSEISIADVRLALEEQFPDISLRTISEFRTGAQKGFILETQATPEEIIPPIEDFLGYKLNQENSSVEFTGATLSQGFYRQLRDAIISAFLLMGWVVFLVFGKSRFVKGLTLILTSFGILLALSEVSAIKTLAILGILIGFLISFLSTKKNKQRIYAFALTIITLILIYSFPSKIIIVPVTIALILLYGFFSIPSVAVILAALADIVMTIAVVNLLGMTLSTAGIIAFLLLIGYSVDTDILLTNRMFETSGTINERLIGAFKTGITMTLTSIIAIFIAFTITKGSSEVLRQIFTILLIGLGFDLFNTWFANASILKWYVEKKEAKE